MSQRTWQQDRSNGHPSLGFPVDFSINAYDYGIRSDGGTHGLVLTKPDVVNLILDLAGYRTEMNLGVKRFLDPACGTGAFIFPAVKRLLLSAKQNKIKPAELEGAILTFDIDLEHVEHCRSVVHKVLRDSQIPVAVAERLVNSWIRHGDFLLAELNSKIDVVVGNPPYIRIEQLSQEIQSEYRERFVTLFDRADLYVAFIEKSLKSLSTNGVLSFICADRWVLNKYGAPLRSLITGGFQVKAYIDLHHASPFETEVIAYPSIFVISKQSSNESVLFTSVKSVKPGMIELFDNIRKGFANDNNPSIAEYNTWFSGDEPWILSSPEQLATLRSLEEAFPALEECGEATVRIGVATGNDSVYIVGNGTGIEPDRLVPLLMREDIKDGSLRNAKRFVINTFKPEGGLVDLKAYPGLAKYLSANEPSLKNRHVAKKNPNGWYRTIDRVYPEIVGKPKLLIPDIGGANEFAFDSGKYFPHHNLYYILSDTWDLEVLGGLLSSRIALFFVWSYAVKMRGGYLRFQAQYLRKICIPRIETLSSELCFAIKGAFRQRDFDCLDELARQAYRLQKLPEFDFMDNRKS